MRDRFCRQAWRVTGGHIENRRHCRIKLRDHEIMSLKFLRTKVSRARSPKTKKRPLPIGARHALADCVSGFFANPENKYRKPVSFETTR